MKQLITYSALFSLLAFSSCEKKQDFNCICEYSTDNDFVELDGTFVQEYDDRFEDDAELECDALETSYKSEYDEASCTLKVRE